MGWKASFFLRPFPDLPYSMFKQMPQLAQRKRWKRRARPVCEQFAHGLAQLHRKATPWAHQDEEGSSLVLVLLFQVLCTGYSAQTRAFFFPAITILDAG